MWTVIMLVECAVNGIALTTVLFRAHVVGADVESAAQAAYDILTVQGGIDPATSRVVDLMAFMGRHEDAVTDTLAICEGLNG